MSTRTIETGLSINTATAMKMASEVFFLNKKVTTVNLRSYNKLFVLSYKGQRKEEQLIKDNIVLVRTVELDSRDVR